MSAEKTVGVILVGGGSKGTRMRPLTLDCPKPLLPIAGKPMVWHPLAALATVPGLTQVVIIGFYEDAVMNPFIKEAKREFPNIGISYLREYKPLGTAGGLYHFRDTILRTPAPSNIFICNIDICSSWPLTEMMALHRKHRGVGTILGVNVPKATATQYGCIVQDPENEGQVLHYVEKPESWISNMVNGGVYLFDRSVFDEIKKAMDSKADNFVQQDPFSQSDEILRLEQDVIAPLAQAKKMYVFETTDFWKQIKTAASAVSASKLYLTRFLKTRPDLLATPTGKDTKPGSAPTIIAPAYIDPSARISPSAKIGPNVAIGPGVYIGDGVRVKDAILLEGTTIERNAAVLNSIVGRDCTIGPWARVDGEEETEADAASGQGKKISVTVFASDVSLAAETLVRSCIVLPNKSLNKSASHQVLL